MITRGNLARALARRGVAEWTVIERQQDIASVDESVHRRRREQLTHLTLIVHHDLPRGRGTARVELRGRDGDARTVVDQAIALAAAAVGPAWKAIPPAAPAKVDVLDPELAKADLGEAALAYLAKLERAVQLPKGTQMQSAVSVVRERVAVQARTGAHVEWMASHIHARTLLANAERSVEVVREARRLSDLAVEVGVTTALADLDQLAGAGPPVAGRCNVILTADAQLHGDELGVWSAFASQADSLLERQGLTRYRLDAPIATNAEQVNEPLTIESNGALDYAVRSAPVGDAGDAVRKFTLVERGKCLNVGLDQREAAMRKRDPNGGVRNLVVFRGTWDGAPPADGRTIEIRRLRALAIEPYTGDASLELGLAIDHRGETATPFTGGTVRLDLISALARARRSAIVIRRGAYQGPASLLVDDAELIA